MEVEIERKYNFLESIFQKLNQKYVALPEDETKRNTQLVLPIINKIIDKMKNRNTLFSTLFQNIFYGGSYYDGLKVGKPSEYDLDCVLRLPKMLEPSIEVSDKPGYVHVMFKNLEALQKKVDEAPKYVGLENLLDGNCLSAKKVKSWMESLMTLVWEPQICDVNLKMNKSGPALTIKFEGVLDGKNFNIDVDVVPCFTFFDDQWPQGYRNNPSKKKKNTFFVVPKTPSDEDVRYWRLSFQEQERELINDYRVMKPTIKLIKKIRDRYQHFSIASYYIKTVFLWELEKVDKSLWEKSLSYVFITMLRIYGEYISKKEIPYYWNENYNLIGHLSDTTASCIANRIKNIIEEINRTCFIQPYNILTYFLSSNEYDIDAFKQEAPLSKKFLKRLEGVNIQPKSPEVLIVTVSETKELSPTPSSVASSFEEIDKDIVNEPSTSQSSGEVEVYESSNQKNSLAKLVNLCETLSTQQERISTLLETVIQKVDNLDARVKELDEEMLSKITEERKERSELVKIVSMLNTKVDDLVKKEKRLEDVEQLFAPIDDMFARTGDFLSPK